MNASPSLSDRLFLGTPAAFICPACGGRLGAPSDDRMVCAGCARPFEVADGIPLLFWPEDGAAPTEAVTQKVRGFYEETPFPDYEDLDSPARLREKACRSLFARLLDEQIPHGAAVLEAGCGTGQLTNFLGLTWGRHVFGTDLSLASLRLAQSFKQAHAVEHAAFYQMNLFRPVFAPETFDIVVSNGVLHHTADPRRGFLTLARLVKRGGHIAVGLYNAIGRLPTHVRRAVFRATGGHLRFLDPYLRRRDIGARKKNAWYEDQYRHPHESCHTMGEVLRWFDEAGVEFVNGIPKPGGGALLSETERLFDARSPGTPLRRGMSQLAMLFGMNPEGGFFVMIGRKR